MISDKFAMYVYTSEMQLYHDSSWACCSAVSSEPPCGACHTLAATGSQGSLGPNLDHLQPDEKRIVQALNQGVGVMPSYKGRLSANQMRELARFIVEATTQKP